MSDQPGQVVFAPGVLMDVDASQAETEETLDPDRFMKTAKKAVADTLNDRDNSIVKFKDPEIPIEEDDLYIVFFAKALNYWRTLISSTRVRGHNWLVTYNGTKNEVYVETFRKIDNDKIQLWRTP